MSELVKYETQSKHCFMVFLKKRFEAVDIVLHRFPWPRAVTRYNGVNINANSVLEQGALSLRSYRCLVV